LNPIRYAKGHGTGNDFVIIADEHQAITVSSVLARRLCDREGGIGADGVLIASRPSEDQKAEGVDLVMGYLNADGSDAQMCGNGIRVLVDYAKELGWLNGWVNSSWLVQTPSGPIAVTDLGEQMYQVEMGAAQIGQSVEVGLEGSTWPATEVHVPNPHAVAFVPDLDSLGEIAAAPELSPRDVFPAGANVELVERLGPNHARMIVYERGSGLTQSCGTGACAVAVVMATNIGHHLEAHDDDLVTPGRYQVDVPGGTLAVIVDTDLRVQLIGPAEITGHGEFDQEWWNANS
jgi:diaminopimelate epimerase